ncbi:hypothetical protein Taro_053829 [Colocasia esculenta]|uniref:Uncharacterized protein n=1 Tax=Colocasia esculenta TaxID=4460 RepID=A0A843XNS6_COLES|nr:hypothetical protein [Colocasia esculenta]
MLAEATSEESRIGRDVISFGSCHQGILNYPSRFCEVKDISGCPSPLLGVCLLGPAWGPPLVCGGGDANAQGRVGVSHARQRAWRAGRWGSRQHARRAGEAGCCRAVVAPPQLCRLSKWAAEAAASPLAASPSPSSHPVPINTPAEMAGSLAQSDPELADLFEDWFSDIDQTLVDVNSSVLAADYRQALDLLDAATDGTSAPSLDAQAVASGTTDSEFQMVPSLPGIDTSDSLSIYAPSPLTVSNPWSPPVAEQIAWEPWPAEWALVVSVVPLPAPPLTITLRTTEGDLVVAEGYIQIL